MPRGPFWQSPRYQRRSAVKPNDDKSDSTPVQFMITCKKTGPYFKNSLRLLRFENFKMTRFQILLLFDHQKVYLIKSVRQCRKRVTNLTPPAMVRVKLRLLNYHCISGWCHHLSGGWLAGSTGNYGA